MQNMNRRTAIVSGVAALSGVAFGTSAAFSQKSQKASSIFDASHNPNLEKIAPYQPRFGRTKPLVAIVGLNEGTIISDFCIPFGVMARSGVADVMSVSVRPGPAR